MLLPKILLTMILSSLVFGMDAYSQEKKSKQKKRQAAPFKWVNGSKRTLPAGVKHVTFRSPSMGVDVGYCLYLPPAYTGEPTRRFPVVYHLHGGRPGSELKSVQLAGFVDAAIRDKKIAPTIYVFPNGGPMSWYNYPGKENWEGEDVFVKELIPHIDKKYRTIGERGGRAIEGFSQGGRGATRIMFKYPQLFCSAAPGGSGYEPEKRIQESGGAESEKVKFAAGDNAWDLAKDFSTRDGAPELRILLWVGTKGFNYEFNLKFSKYLDELGIGHQSLVVPDATHSAKLIYQKKGTELMRFHQQGFDSK
ncbi:MAG: enterochelin esterase-like enzyme [Verrucomicrobiales bacterium]|jgi:enterochelin esterase-like enzyme